MDSSARVDAEASARDRRVDAAALTSSTSSSRCTTRRTTCAPAWRACSRTCGPTCASWSSTTHRPILRIAPLFEELGARAHPQLVLLRNDRQPGLYRDREPRHAAVARGRDPAQFGHDRQRGLARRDHALRGDRSAHRHDHAVLEQCGDLLVPAILREQSVAGGRRSRPHATRRSPRLQYPCIPTCRRASASVSTFAVRCSTRSAISTRRRSARAMARKTTCACARRRPDGATCWRTTRSWFTPASARLRAARPRSRSGTWACCCDRHPHYMDMVREFIAADPFRAIRELAQMRIAIDAAPSRGVLHIVHHHGGGTESHVRALVEGSREPSWRHYIAIAVEDRWQIEAHGNDGTRSRHSSSFATRASRGRRSWAASAASLGITLIHVHNISGCRNGILEALAAAAHSRGLHDPRPQLRVPDDHDVARRDRSSAAA